jgi:hypothetical protein
MAISPTPSLLLGQEDAGLLDLLLLGHEAALGLLRHRICSQGLCLWGHFGQLFVSVYFCLFLFFSIYFCFFLFFTGSICTDGLCV